MVGTVQTGDPVTGASGPSHAFLYQGGVIHDLGTMGTFPASYAYGINDGGQIVGLAKDSIGDQHAFLYQNGAFTDLGTLAGYADSNALAINAAGDVVGNSTDNAGQSGRAFAYSRGVMTDPGTLAGQTTSMAGGINGLGQIVGTSGLHAFLDTGGQIVDLNTLLAPCQRSIFDPVRSRHTDGWVLQSATGINDRGQVIGYGLNYLGGVGTGGAFLLTLAPAPEPSQPAALGLGVLSLTGLVVRGRRKQGRPVRQ